MDHASSPSPLYTVQSSTKAIPNPSSSSSIMPQLAIAECVPPKSSAQQQSTVYIDQEKVLGRGQYSTVCLGKLKSESNNTGEGGIACAVKIPHENNLDAQELGIIEAAALSRLGPTSTITIQCFGLVNLREMAAAGNNSCRLYSWKEVASRVVAAAKEEHWALVLEYCELGPCWSWMLENRMAMDAELFFCWARQLTLALVALREAGIAHKDVKAHNVLLDHNGNVRLADFTAAEFSQQALGSLNKECPKFKPASFPAYTDFSGTIPYSAPEALGMSINRKMADAKDLHKMDVYSLGVSLYTLFVSGREPYASVKSGVEQMLLASKGAFWEWEERQYLASLQNRDNNSAAAKSTPVTPLDEPPTMLGRTRPPSPNSTITTTTLLARSASLNTRPISNSGGGITRRRTLRNRKPALQEYKRFQSGDVLPPAVNALLQSMANPDPQQRPGAVEILRMLDSMEAEIFDVEPL